MSINKITEKYLAFDNAKVCVKEIGQGPIIVILHGWLHSSSRWESIARKLSDNYKVYLIDVPGFGKSTINTNSKTKYMDDIAIILGDVLNSITSKKIYAMICHCLGGQLFYKLIKTNSIEAPSKLILCSFPFYGVNRLKMMAQFRGLNEFALKAIKSFKLKRLIKLLARFTVKDKKYIDNIIVDDVLKADSHVAAYLLKDIVYYNFDNYFSQIDSEILAIRGKHDWVATSKAYNSVKAKLNFKFSEFQNSSHTPMCEEEAKFIKGVSAFLGNNYSKKM